MSELTVREFRDGDEQAFLMMGRWLQENSHFKDCGFSVSKMLMIFANLVTKNPDYFGVIVETEDGQPAGCMIANLQEYFFSREKIATDLSFGLLPEPEFRKQAGKIMPEIFARYEAWARASGAIEVAAGTSTGAHGNKLQAFLNSIGYQTVGFNTKKRI